MKYATDRGKSLYGTVGVWKEWLNYEI
jgi:hypothetical protein